MSFFDKIFGGSNKVNEISEVPWNKLEDIDEIESIINLSDSKPVVIFKHSTRCGISRMVLNGFEKSYDLTAEDARLYFVDLLRHRDVSNELADRFKVIHQSPQLLIIRGGEVVYHASHGAIETEVVKKYV